MATPDDSNVYDLENGVYSSSLLFLKEVSFMVCNEFQQRAVLTCLREMGYSNTGSSSCSVKCGPPGTEKSTTIVTSISAILHSSRFGHFEIGSRFKKLSVENNHL